MTKEQAIEILAATVPGYAHESDAYDYFEALAAAGAFTDGAATEAYRIANRLRGCRNEGVREGLVERLCALLGGDPEPGAVLHPDTGIVMPDMQPSRPVANGASEDE